MYIFYFNELHFKHRRISSKKHRTLKTWTFLSTLFNGSGRIMLADSQSIKGKMVNKFHEKQCIVSKTEIMKQSTQLLH